jgi:hypothetical protein
MVTIATPIVVWSASSGLITSFNVCIYCFGALHLSLVVYIIATNILGALHHSLMLQNSKIFAGIEIW